MNNTGDKNGIIQSKLVGDPDWSELKIPSTYGKGTHFLLGDKDKDRFQMKYFKCIKDNSFFAKIWFGPATQGPPGHAHGGSMAALLDEGMGISAWIKGFPSVAAKITVEFKNMLPLKSVVTLSARVTSVDERKIYTKGELYSDDNSIFAVSEGLFIALPEDKISDFVSEFL